VRVPGWCVRKALALFSLLILLVPVTAAFASATLWLWPNGRVRVRVVTLGKVRETRALRTMRDVSAFLGMTGQAVRDRWDSREAYEKTYGR
jgi:hypothetical protein